MKNLLTKDTISTTIPIPALGQLQELDVDLGNGAAVLRLHLQSQLAEERIITKEQYEDFEYRQVQIHDPPPTTQTQRNYIYLVFLIELPLLHYPPLPFT